MKAGGGDSNSGDHSNVLQLPGDSVGYVIGHKGENIKRLEQESGCRINLDRSQPGLDYRNIRIVGRSAESVEKASQLIQQSVKEAAMRGAGGGHVQQQMQMQQRCRCSRR